MILYSDRKKIAEAYKKWIKENSQIADVPINMVTFVSDMLDEEKVKIFLDKIKR